MATVKKGSPARVEAGSKDKSSEAVQKAPGARLRMGTIGCQLSFDGISLRRAIGEEFKQTAAEAIETSADDLSATYRLFAKEDLSEVHSCKQAIKAYWRSYTLPYTEIGVRLLPHAQLEQFRQGLVPMVGNFLAAVVSLQEKMPEIKARRKEKLGSLYDAGNYPDNVRTEFSVELTYPSLEPPNYLMKLDPKLYQEEVARVREQMSQAAVLAETVFAAEMLKVVTGLRESVNNVAQGKQRWFRDATANHVFEVLAEFQQKLLPFGIAADGPLQQCLQDLKKVVGNYTEKSLPAALRSEPQFRDQVVSQFAKIQEGLSELIETRTVMRRRVVR